MILCDTGPLVALIDRDDQYHREAIQTLQTLPAVSLMTTWPCLVEAMYLLWRAGGLDAQEELWGYLADGLVVLHQPREGDWQRMREQSRKYHDIPMDLADASLVVAAEQHGIQKIFTFDQHFHAYRIDDRDPFQTIP